MNPTKIVWFVLEDSAYVINYKLRQLAGVNEELAKVFHDSSGIPLYRSTFSLPSSSLAMFIYARGALVE